MPTITRQLDTDAGKVLIFANPAEAHGVAADRIAATIREAVGSRGRAVLGLATGATPIPTYDRLCAMHAEGGLSFRDVRSYNLDEYYPISPLDKNSYRSYMHRHLFSRVDILPQQAHLLDGTVPEAFAAEHCAAYDRWIAADGGLDLQLLGIGRNGHVGFNEPADLPVSEALALPTRPIALHPTTRADAVKDFGGTLDDVPTGALTVGTAQILAARSILILAFGPNKSEAVAASLKGPMTAQVPASLLQSARDRVTWLIDEAAAGGL